MIVCVCKAVSDRSVARAVEGGAGTIAEVGRCTGAGLGCGSCHEAIACAIDDARRRRGRSALVVLPLLAAALTT